MTTITFSRSTTAFGEEVQEVELREPTGAEIRRIGLPFMSLPSGAIDFDMDRVAQYAVLLAKPALTPMAVDKLGGGDLIRLAVGLAPFFGDSTIPPTS
ncbi:phage tail assembly protein [Ancylobacter sp. 6x-1]|uniref:Phage tail assembly protein n=1 Tax=Ancylobacter crimeensis TaxID=2579147 RepID=A0ABT0DAG9_9HYPH|nr:phage tail assembly protein [Ancylobacter crimeensis]MCK0196899.1 phage tail assembly protein [Ancylobacter crimeensis]